MTEFSLKDKYVVITGASSGLGKQIAIEAAKKGANLILLARRIKALTELKQHIKNNINSSVVIHVFELDVSDLSDVETIFNKIKLTIPSIDILVNNAGFGVFEELMEADLKQVGEMLNVNVLGLIACTKLVLPNMLASNQGHIINIASQAGKIATPKSSGYAASKHAVLGFTNSLRLEVANLNITVSAVNPGPIQTDFFQRADPTGTYEKNIKRYMLNSSYVASKIVQLMIKPKRELNLPWWMNIGSKLYQTFPALVEKVARPTFYKK
jgi:uncharacterized protein